MHDDTKRKAVEKLYPWTLWQRVVMVLTAFFVSIFMSGVTTGHLAFREVLLMSKDYLCHTQQEMHQGTTCYRQELLLNGAFFISTLVVKFLSLPIGVVLDAYGPRATSMFGCVIFAVGCLLLAASDLSMGWLHHFGFCVLAIGGVCVYVPTLQLCRILPELSGLMMAIMTSAFDASAIVFYLIGLIFKHFRGTISIHQILTAYTAVPIIGFILVTSFYPDGDIPVMGRKKEKSWEGSSINILHSGRGIQKMLCSFDFWIAAIFSSIMTTRFTHFLATFNIRLARTGLSWEFQRSVLTGFQTFFPLGGLISMTAVGQLLHSFPLSVNVLILWGLMVFLWEPIMNGRAHDVQAASVLLCSLLRPYCYAVHNQLCERLFNRGQLGHTYGLLLLVSGLVNMSIMYIVYDSQQLKFWVSVQIWNAVKLGSKLTFVFAIYLFYRRL